MKTYLILFILLLSCTVMAEEEFKPGFSDFGIKIGGGSSSIASDIAILQDIDNMGSLNLGLMLYYRLQPQWSLRSEILLTFKGAGGSFLGFTQELQVNYIEIPILLEYSPFPQRRFAPFFNAGIAPAIATDAEYDGGLFSSEVDLNDAVNTFDFTLYLGGGLKWGHFIGDIRYGIGLVNTFDNAKWNELIYAGTSNDDYYMRENDSIMNRFLYFSLAFVF